MMLALEEFQADAHSLHGHGPVPYKRHVALCTEAFRSGSKAGKQEADAAHTAALSETSARIAACIAALDADKSATEAQITRDCAIALTQILSRLMPVLAERAFADQVRDLAASALATAPRPLRLSVAPGATATATEALDSAGISGIEIVEDDTQAPGQCHARWAEGAATLDFDALTARIVALIEDTTGIPFPERGTAGAATDQPDSDTEGRTA